MVKFWDSLKIRGLELATQEPEMAGKTKKLSLTRSWSLAQLLAVACAFVVHPVHAIDFKYGNKYNMNNQHSAGTGNVEVNVTWSSVPLLSESTTSYVPLPSGCECLDLAQTNKTCTAFQCHETCNLNIGQCDEFCCSDPDCTSDDIARFQSVGECLPDGSSTDSTLCTDTTSLDQVNEKYNLYVESDDRALNGFLCVSVVNNPIEGEYFNPQTSLVNNYAVLDSSDYTPDYSFAISEASDAESGESAYLPGDNIIAAWGSESLRAIWGGLLSLPTAGPDGTCIDNNYVEYGTDVQVNDCTQVIIDLAATCQEEYGPLSATLFGELLHIGLIPSATVSTPSSNWQKVTVENLYSKSLSNGAITSLQEATSAPTVSPTAAPTLATGSPTVTTTGSPTSVNSTGTPTDAPTPQPTAARRQLQVATVPTTTWDASTQTCQNAVVGVEYTIEHNSIGEISDFQVDLTLANIPLGALDSVAVTQSYHVNFINTESNSVSTAPERVVSGNPGYIKGLPVQAGSITTQDSGTDDEKTAIAYLPDGLAIMSAAGSRGDCFDLTGSSNKWYDVISNTSVMETPVLFGVDAVSTCTVSLTYSDFQDMTSWCVDRRSAPIFTMGADRIGIYGNANPWSAWEWVTLHRETSQLSSTAQSSVPGTLTCANMIDRVSIEILWTNSGELGNPQPMILTARAYVDQSDWQWRKTANSNATQKFTIQHTVTFVEHKLSAEDRFAYKPEVPPIIPAIPADVFYPFDIVSAAPRQNQFTLAAVLLFVFAFAQVF